MPINSVSLNGLFSPADLQLPRRRIDGMEKGPSEGLLPSLFSSSRDLSGSVSSSPHPISLDHLPLPSTQPAPAVLGQHDQESPVRV